MLVGTGNLPKFTDNLYSIAEEPDKYLIPTSEVPLTNFHREEILDGSDLPVRLTAYSANFRREQFSAGRDMRGIKRGHQFDKVEMVRLEKPEDSKAALHTLIRGCRGRSCGTWRSPTASSRCVPAISRSSRRRSSIWRRGRPAATSGWKSPPAATSPISRPAAPISASAASRARGPSSSIRLNGSGLALPRLMIAIMENYQNADGTITIPEVIRPYMRGMERIEREK